MSVVTVQVNGSRQYYDVKHVTYFKLDLKGLEIAFILDGQLFEYVKDGFQKRCSNDYRSVLSKDDFKTLSYQIERNLVNRGLLN